MRRFRFSLRWLLVFMGLLAVLLGIVGQRVVDARKQRELIFLIQEYGGENHHEMNFTSEAERTIRFGNLEFDPRLPGPLWLRRLVGDEYFVRVEEAFFDKQSHRVLDDHAFAELVRKLSSRGLRRPRGLVFCELPITDASLAELTAFPELTSLHVIDCPGVTDAGLEHIQSLTKLRRLDLRGSAITDHGLKCLAGLSELRELSLQQTAISDRGMQTLVDLRRLEWLGLAGTSVTSGGRQILRQHMPDCEVTW